MILDTLSARYQTYPFLQRVGLMVCLGAIAPLCWLYFQRGIVSAQIQQARSDKSIAAANLDATKKAKSELPVKLRSLSAARHSLSNISSTVATMFDIDEILRKTTNNAKQNGVHIEVFRPDQPFETGEKVRYGKQEINLAVRGNYANVTRFLDGMLGIGPLAYLTEISYQQVLLPNIEDRTFDDERYEPVNERATVRAVAKVLVFKKVTFNEKLAIAN